MQHQLLERFVLVKQLSAQRAHRGTHLVAPKKVVRFPNLQLCRVDLRWKTVSTEFKHNMVLKRRVPPVEFFVKLRNLAYCVAEQVQVVQIALFNFLMIVVLVRLRFEGKLICPNHDVLLKLIERNFDVDNPFLCPSNELCIRYIWTQQGADHLLEIESHIISALENLEVVHP